MKTYAIKEVLKTLQGEGVNSGRAAVFIRFAGCNLWSGRGEDRASGWISVSSAFPRATSCMGGQ